MVSQWFSCFQRSSLLDSDSDAFQLWSPRLPNTLHDPDDQFGSILDRCLPPSGGTFPNRGSHVRIGCLPPAVRDHELCCPLCYYHGKQWGYDLDVRVLAWCHRDLLPPRDIWSKTSRYCQGLPPLWPVRCLFILQTFETVEA